jgi:hypothetical protein
VEQLTADCLIFNQMLMREGGGIIPSEVQNNNYNGKCSGVIHRDRINISSSVSLRQRKTPRSTLQRNNLYLKQIVQLL